MGLEARIQTRLDGFTLDVDLNIGPELAVLFGYSGAGKSMTLKTIAGIMKQGAGRIVLNGRVLFDRKKGINLEPARRSVGYVFQDLALFPHMTVEKNILYGAKGVPRRSARADADEMIHLFRLSGLEGKYPREISMGQRQRVAFARALIRKPEILLLDEPFSGLDNPLRLEMRRCLANVVESRFRIPAVLVTHDLLEAYTLADRIFIYSKGRVIQSGRPQVVFSNPVDREVSSLVNLKALYPDCLFT